MLGLFFRSQLTCFFLVIFIYLLFIYLFVCFVYCGAYVCHSTHVETRGQCERDVFSFQRFESQELNSDHLAWLTAHLPNLISHNDIRKHISPPCVFRKGLSLNLALAYLIRLADQWVPGICLSLLLSTGDYAFPTIPDYLYGVWKPNSGTHTCTANTLLAEWSSSHPDSHF